MKTLTKEDLPIGTKVVPHGKTVIGSISFEECDCWNTLGGKTQGFLYVIKHKDNYLVLSQENDEQGSHYNYSDVTLYEEKPKIKKKELKMEIEDLKEEVSNLRETLQAFIDEKNTVEPKTMTVEERDKLAEPFNPNQYEIGTLGIFWDGDFDERINSNYVYFGRLEIVTDSGKFIRKNNPWLWKNFKPIKLD